MLAFILAAMLPRGGPLQQAFDLIEINHVYSTTGDHVLSQVLFCRWHALENDYHVHDWRLLEHPSQVPRPNWLTGCFETTWLDKGGALRRVTTRTLRKTNTPYDVEWLDRRVWRVEWRHGLIEPPGGPKGRRLENN